MSNNPLSLLLADDDNDDCLLFEEALLELPILTHLSVVNDGEELMQYLNKNIADLPYILFLDLNIPRKNGMECLKEIKTNPLLRELHVVIFSTAAELDLVNSLYKNGAQHYIRKPSEFTQLKKVMEHALSMITGKKIVQPPKESFVITGDL